MKSYRHPTCDHPVQTVQDGPSAEYAYAFPCAECSNNGVHVRLVVSDPVEVEPGRAVCKGEKRVYVKTYGDAPDYTARWVRVVQTSEEL